MIKTFLVTGCAGFIGSHMTDYLLRKGYNVIGVDNFISGKKTNLELALKNKRFKLYKDNLQNPSKIIKKHKKIKYVFHFAGHGELVPSIENPLEYLNNNSFITAKLLDAVYKYLKVKKFVYAASSSCYGINNSKTSEISPIRIEHPYALSKYIGEICVMHWSKVYKIPVDSIRIFNAYGPRSRTNNVYGAVIGVFLKQKLSNYPLTIVGDGKQRRDFLYISDVCEAFYKVAKSKQKNQIYNLGFGKSESINKLSKMISNSKIFIPWRPGEPKITEADISKIKKLTGWYPKVNLEQGINNVLKNINYWKKAPLWTKKKIKNSVKNWNKLLK